MLKRVLILPVFVLALCLPTALLAKVDREACNAQDQLFTLMTSTDIFLKFLETGKPANAPEHLQIAILDFDSGNLKQKMMTAGLENALAPTAKLLTNQRKLLNKYIKSGRSGARSLAEQLNAGSQLSAFQKQILPLPCDETERNSQTGAAPLGTSAPFPVGPISVLATLLLLTLALLLTLMEKRDALKKRRWKRHACVLNCQMVCHGRSMQTQVVDLSQMGAKIRVECECAVGTKLELDLPEKKVSGKVVWRNANYAGLSFNRRLSGSQLKKILEHSGQIDMTEAPDLGPFNIVS